MALSLDELKVEIQQSVKQISDAVQARDLEIKSYGEASKATVAKLDAATARLDAMKADLDGAIVAKENVDKRLLDMEKQLGRIGMGGAGGAERKSWGQQFTESDSYKGAQAARMNRTSPARINKDLTSVTGSGGPLIRPDRRPDVVVPPQRSMTVRNLLPSIPTESNAVEVMRQLAFTNNANMQGVAQASAYELLAKPESELTYELVTVPVRTIAHHFVASRQVMKDARMLQALIDNRLEYGIDLKVEQQLLFGAGTGQQFTGLMVDSAVSDLGSIPVLGVNDTVAGAMIDHVRRAITVNQTNEFYNVNGLVLNPNDWEVIELAKGTDGHYIWVNVPDGGRMRLWRVPAVITNSMTEGNFILGDFTLGATIYDREEFEIRIAEQHDDLFIKNGVVVLGEERLAFGIELPLAFTKGDFTVLT